MRARHICDDKMYLGGYDIIKQIISCKDET